MAVQLILVKTDGTGSAPNHANVQLLGGTNNGYSTVIVQDNVRFTFYTDGTVTQRRGLFGSDTSENAWWIPAPEANIGDYYEISYTKNSGVDAMNEFNGGMDEGVWYPLTSDIVLAVSSDSPGPRSGNYTVNIRDIATQTTHATGTYDLDIFLSF